MPDFGAVVNKDKKQTSPADDMSKAENKEEGAVQSPVNDRPWAMDSAGGATSSAGGETEAPKDPGAWGAMHTMTDNEIHGHRKVFVGIHIPGGGSRNRRSGGAGGGSGGGGGGGGGLSGSSGPGGASGGAGGGGSSSSSGTHSKGGKHHRHRGKNSKDTNDQRPATPPSQRVQFILGEDHDDAGGGGGGGHEPHPLFSEMEELFLDDDGELEWKETARWVKFEEDVEEGGNRWSKPHVATLSLHSLFELRSMLLNGTVCLDMTANNLDEIADLVLDNMVNANVISFDKKAVIKDAFLKRHRHQHEERGGGKKSTLLSVGDASSSNMSRLPLIRSLAEIGRNHSTSKSE